MKLLLIDHGNTRIKWATVRGRGPLRVAGSRPSTGLTDAWIRALASRYARHTAVLATVVPKSYHAWSEAFAGRMLFASGGQHNLHKLFAYPRPEEVGADRVAAAFAVRELGLYPAIIVACGTATAYTVVNAKGKLCGGAIAPGLQAQLDALLGATAQLPAVKLRRTRRALAKSTQEAIRAGIIMSFEGGVKETVARLSQALPRGKKPRIILTGGNAELAVKALGGRAVLRPLLVLEGLRIIGERFLEDVA